MEKIRPIKDSAVPKASVIIPAYNHEKFLEEAIYSVLDQTVADFELIIINDGSSDRSEEVVRGIEDKRIRYFYQENQGAHHAINRGIGLAKGEYVSILNSDDVYDPKRLETFLKILEADISVHAMVSYIEFMDENGKFIRHKRGTEDNWLRHAPETSFKGENNILLDLLAGNFFISTSNLFCRRTVFQDIGFFRNLRYSHDYDFFLRLCYHFNVRVVDSPLLKYRIHSANTFNPSDRKTMAQADFEVGLILSEFLLNNDLKRIFPDDDIYTLMAKFFNSLDTFNSERMIMTLALFGFTYKIGGEFFKTLTDEPNPLFRKVCTDYFENHLNLWDESQKAWRKCSETNDRLIHAEKRLAQAENEAKKWYLESQKAWSQWSETNERLIINENKLAEVQNDAKNYYLEAQEAQSKWSETNDRLISTEKKLEEAQNKVKNCYLEAQKARDEKFSLNEKLTDSENSVMQAEDEAKKWQQKSEEADHRLQDIRSELDSVFRSRTYRLGTLFRDAYQSRKQFLLLPLRFVWFFFPEGFKSKIRPFYQKDRSGISAIKNKKWPENKPLISVVIPCYNYGKYIGQAVDSVLNQTVKKIEIIVVDGGSDGKTLDILKKLNTPKTKILFRKGRHLVGSNRNYGIKSAKGKYICCLDADDILKPTYLEKALFYLETYNDDVVYPSVQCFGEDDLLWKAVPTNFQDNIAIGNAVSTVAVFKKKAWVKAGGYKDWPAGAKHVPEDWEYWTRLLGFGFRFRRLKEPLMLYRVHGEGLTAQCQTTLEEQKEIIKKENINLFTEKNLNDIAERSRRIYRVKYPYINLKTPVQSGRKNVLFALPFMIMGGADTVLLKIAGYLSKKDCNIYAVTTLPSDSRFGDNTAAYEKIAEGVYHLPDFLENEKEYKDFIFYLITAKQIHLIFLAGSEFVYHLLPEIRQHFPSVKIADQLFNECGHIQNNRNYSEFIDLNIAENRNVEKVLVTEYHEDASKVRLISNGVDVYGEFSPVNLDKFQLNEIYQEYGIPPDKFIISFLGRFSEEKSPDFFIEIAEKFRDRPEIFFIAAGQGPLFEMIQKKIRDKNLGHKVLLPGIVNAQKVLALTHLVVLPSKIDGRPNIILESLSMGIPVVASGVGGIPELILDGKNGFLCRPGDIHDFISKINILLNNQERYEAFRISAREFAVSNFDMAEMMNIYDHTFSRLLSESEKQ